PSASQAARRRRRSGPTRGQLTERGDMAAKAKAPPVPDAIAGANGSLRVARAGGADLTVGEGHVLDIQRARILAAMVEECAERGVANVSVAHVVGRAGVSRRTFYEIFSDGEDCFLGAFDEGIARASRYVLDSHDPSAGWAERVLLPWSVGGAYSPKSSPSSTRGVRSRRLATTCHPSRQRGSSAGSCLSCMRGCSKTIQVGLSSWPGP